MQTTASLFERGPSIARCSRLKTSQAQAEDDTDRSGGRASQAVKVRNRSRNTRALGHSTGGDIDSKRSSPRATGT
jgi:hypothetical protein